MHDGLAEVAVHGDFNGVRDFRKASEKASVSEPGTPRSGTKGQARRLAAHHIGSCRSRRTARTSPGQFRRDTP